MATDLDLRATSDAPVLVTGASGHLGGHSVAQLLTAGYRVRATIRNRNQQGRILAMLGRSGSAASADLAFVHASLSSDDGWDAAMEGTQYVLHHASPFPAVEPADADDIIRPARDGALRVLAAARRAGVERVVLTSSYAAIGYTVKPDRHYSEADWTNPDDVIPAYHKSKTLAELAAWEAVRVWGGPELSVINPTGIFGPLLDERLSASTGLVKALLDGSLATVPRMFFGVVDVRDVVDVHLRAMRHSAAAGERFIAVGGPAVSYLDVAKMLARLLPQRDHRAVPRELSDDEVREAAATDPALRAAAALKGQVPVISGEKARRVLGWQPRDVETAIAETAHSLIACGLA